MPIDKPIIYAIKSNHLSAPVSLAFASHFRIPQKTIAVNKDDNAYTSDSTAENQKLSEKV
ncbi:hypothetical protein D3C72_2300500 [compost metagenome]